jgi:uncharacterized protein YecT (DUF1311 family)
MRILIFALLLAISSSLSAAETAVPICDNNAPDAERCIEKREKWFETRLNNTYRQITAILDKPRGEYASNFPEMRKGLIASQRAWVAYRKAAIDFEDRMRVNAPPMDRHVHQRVLSIDLTERRVKELEDILQSMQRIAASGT